MDLVIFNRTELFAVARALRVIAEVNQRFTAPEADFISTIGALHGVPIDAHALDSITPEALALLVTDPHRRKRALQLLIVMAFVEGEINPYAEDMLGRFAEALEQGEDGLAVVREIVDEQFLLARFDMFRRLRTAMLKGQTFKTLSSLATAFVFGEDHEVAEKYRQLAHYPEGTVGRELFDSWQLHGFGVPGEKGSMIERGVFHDVGHLLSGYGVDPAGEIRQAAFQAGFVRNDGFAFLLFAMLQFHLGLQITPIAKGETGYFVVKDVLEAAARGAQCKVDLSATDWDFWKVAGVPLTELRARYGVPPLA